MSLIHAGMLDRLIRLERAARPAGRGKAGQESWSLVAEVWAQVQDSLPSRGERLADGLTMASRPARVRIYYREDLTSDMRVVDGGRVMKIMTQPAEIGRREGLEFMVQDFSTAGPGA